MKIIYQNFTYNEDIDVLVRVYENQSKSYKEEDQISVEILFKPYTSMNHIRATAWLPKGAAYFVTQKLKEIKHTNFKVQISNELHSQVGVLTSCNENFNIVIQELLENI